MLRSCILLAFVLVGFSFVESAEDNCITDKVVVCYYASWSKYRDNEGQFNISHIDPHLCTHLVYTFAGLDAGSGVMSLDYYQDVDLGGYKTFNELKLQNPCLKTILAVGGWNEGSRKYSIMSYSEESRERFAESALRFLAHYGFDGLDMDWEYPTSRGGIPEDKDNFVKLLAKIKGKLDIWDMTLSVAIPLTSEGTKDYFDMPEIAKIVDFVHLMAYDFTGTGSPVTGLLAPMSAIESSVESWLSAGIPSKKLILGLPSYVRTFTLADPKKTGIGAPVSGPGQAGEFTKEAGFLSYYELLYENIEESFTIKEEDGTRYAYFEEKWFSFDDEDTYKAKVNYAKSKGLGGMMVWSIDTDDFAPHFGEEAFPILHIIKNIIF